MIVDFLQLRQLSGLKRKSDVRRWLRKNGVAYLVQSSGDPVTTLDAINLAMYGNAKITKPDFTPPPCYRPKSGKNTAVISMSTKKSGTNSAE